MFRYIHAKDVFERSYAKFLSKRLLKKKSEDMFREESFVEKLKKECGHLFTHRLELMFIDIKNGYEFAKEFKEMGKEKDKKGVAKMTDIEMDF